MSGAPSNGPRNGSPGNKGVLVGVVDLSQKIVATLPPAFLLLVLINALFIGVVMWFLDSQAKQRTELVEKLIDRCMEIALRAEPPSH
jgi:hypothetical protein